MRKTGELKWHLFLKVRGCKVYDIQTGQVVESASEVSSLAEQLSHLKAQRFHCYDFARFTYIESLVRRAAKQRESVRQLLESKAQLALDNYLVAREKARLASEELINTLFIDSSFIDASDDELNETTKASQLIVQANDYHQQGYFDKVQQLARQWQSSAKTVENKNCTTSALIELRQYLAEPLRSEKSDRAVEDDFIELLRQQDKQLFDKNNHSPANNVNSKSSTGSSSSAVTALRSSRVYQQLQEKKRVDNFIDTAFNETPENPGPLNPERLAIRLLKEINNRSPEYMSRYASYFETLQWLNKAGS